MTIRECLECRRERTLRARGLCGSCYNRAVKRLREEGAPLPAKERRGGEAYLEESTGPPDMCWPWTGPVSAHGYGIAALASGRTYAHRVAYERAHGPIPDGLDVDHLCRVRSCVNPDHLEAVTRAENLRRAVPYRTPQTTRLGRNTCTHGDQDVYLDPDGKRVCRPCRRERTRLWRNDPAYNYTPRESDPTS